MNALPAQDQNDAETRGIALCHPIEERHRESSQSRLRLDGEFLGSAALFTVDSTFSHHPRLSNGIEIWDIGWPMKMSAGECDTHCIEYFFRLFWSMGSGSMILENRSRAINASWNT
jgi:hypothetical protein